MFHASQGTLQCLLFANEGCIFLARKSEEITQLRILSKIVMQMNFPVLTSIL